MFAQPDSRYLPLQMRSSQTLPERAILRVVRLAPSFSQLAPGRRDASTQHACVSGHNTLAPGHPPECHAGGSPSLAHAPCPSSGARCLSQRPFLVAQPSVLTSVPPNLLQLLPLEHASQVSLQVVQSAG